MELNFICGGAPKSGTTTIYDILKNHPDICLSSFKEPSFFNNNNYENGMEWYYKTYFSKYSNEKIVGDCTPMYLASKIAIDNIKKENFKSIKFLFILRNPIDRAYSQYLHSKRDLVEELDFQNALKVEERRLNQYEKEENEIRIIKHGYIKHSLYYSNINKYINEFGKENIKIITFEDFIINMKENIKDILSFLDIDQSFDFDESLNSNKSSVPRSITLKKILAKEMLIKKTFKIILPKITRQKIRNYIQSINNKPKEYKGITGEEYLNIYNSYFKEDIKNLENLLNVNFDHWKLRE